MNIANKILDVLFDYVVLPDEDKRKVVRFVASCHLQGSFDWAQLLFVLASESESGKSRLKNIISWLVPNAKPSSDPSAPYVYTEITAAKLHKPNGFVPTLILDEMGKYYDGKKITSQMTAVLGNGRTKDEPTTRVARDDKGNRIVETLETFAPVVIAGMRNESQGFFPNDLLNRGHIISLTKRTSDEKIKRFIPRDVKKRCNAIRDELAK